MTWPAKLTAPLCALLLLVATFPRADAASDSPVVSKDGHTFTLEDLSLYFLRNLGKDGLLDYLQNMVVYQEGVTQGLKPSAQETATFVDKTMGRDVYTEFKQLFSAHAVDQLVEYTLVNDKYEKWLRDKIKQDNGLTVTEKEARDYFIGHTDQFHLPEGVYLSIISVPDQGQANAVLARLNKGEDFNKVAGEVNMDPRMRAARGEIGVYRKGDPNGLPAELETAAFALKEGTYTKTPVKGTNYHILYVAKKYAAVSPKFEDIRETLESQLLDDKIDPLYEDYLTKLMQRELPRFQILAGLFKPSDVDTSKPLTPPSKSIAPPRGGKGGRQ